MRVYEKSILLASGMLIILNAFDGLMTFWGLKFMVIEEANPLTRVLITKLPFVLIGTKLFLPVFLGVFCWVARERSQRLVKYSLSLALGIYLLTNLMHIFWWLNIN